MATSKKPVKRLPKRQLAKVQHEWLKARKMEGAWIVMRIDDYHTLAANRGQFYPVANREDDANKAIWPTEALAMGAAAWASRNFGNMYGVFKMVAVVERTIAPVMVSKV